MLSILTALMIAIGAAPAGARTDNCLMPTWALGQDVAFSCDFKDALAVAHSGAPVGFTGRRTHAVFRGQVTHTQQPMVFVASDRVVPLKDAPLNAALIGAQGGWVDGEGRAHGARDAWTLNLSDAGVSEQTAGTLVGWALSTPPAAR